MAESGNLNLDLGLWASQSLSLPNSRVCNVWKMFPGAKLNTILNDSIQYPWRCRCRSRCELWIMPIKDTPWGVLQPLASSSASFMGWTRPCETIFCVPLFLFFAFHEEWAALLLQSWGQLPVLLSCWELWHTMSCLCRLLADFYFVPPTKKWKVPLTEVAGSSLLHRGKHDT